MSMLLIFPLYILSLRLLITGSEVGFLLETGRLVLESFGGGVGATAELTIGPDSDNAGSDKDELAFVSSVFGPLR